MQGLILAAGMGTRLGEYTKEIPKVMVEVQGQPLLFYALERLYEQGVTETIIVVGYKKEYIMEKCGNAYKDMKLTFVENERYSTTNNVYSFYLASQHVTDDVLMVEGDLLFSKELLDYTISTKHDCNIVVSKYNPETMNGTVISADGDQATGLIIKKFQTEGFDYDKVWKTVNIYYFGKQFMEKFSKMLGLYVETGNLNNYYELVLGALIYYGDDDIRIVTVDEDDWFEIDDERDLMIARKHGGF
jgi:choline kinase